MSIALNPNHKYKIHTPFGWQNFSGIQKLTKDKMVELVFEDEIKPFKCSLNHPLRTPEGTIIKAGELIEGDVLEHATKEFVVLKSINFIDGPVELYDILDSGLERLFYSDGLVSHNCEFIGSSNTLLSPDTLQNLAWESPIRQVPLRFCDFGDGTRANLEIYDMPVNDRQYVLVADVAGGKELDYSAFVVIDITGFPYKVSATFRSNKISPMFYPDVIVQAATIYNMAHVMIETNDNSVAEKVHQNLEYENIITTRSKAKKTKVGSGFGKNVEFGIRETRSTKKQGCENLKTLIENKKLLVKDYNTILELHTFVWNNKSSWSAEEGKNDDLVMCLVNFSWLVDDQYFKDLTNSDVYASLVKQYQESIEDDFTPFGHLDSMCDPNSDFIDDDGFRL